MSVRLRDIAAYLDGGLVRVKNQRRCRAYDSSDTTKRHLPEKEQVTRENAMSRQKTPQVVQSNPVSTQDNLRLPRQDEPGMNGALHRVMAPQRPLLSIRIPQAGNSD